MLNQFIPREVVRSVYDIDLDALKQRGFKGLITDLDNTLVGARVPYATPELADWLKLVQSRGFKIVIVSNNSRERVSAFAEPLSVPFIHRAKKPIRFAFRKSLNIMQLGANEAAMIGDQMLTDILGANRMGIHTILVEPIAIQDESPFTKINRRIERFVVAALRKNGWEDSHG
ncbi:YqeG family HAD IIIA-type phosphatase [Ferviditalea candida]|uniref:YqeG family HAD IIIA-type phosphatase n=1 Tax=Ferviditalea candida TaxID=3108399 RepID=A0ABU5ZE53_9BACL|nr:YqeG family HAD IIIA-type phosphatase [Paenibacillaceae bacterium T2]